MSYKAISIIMILTAVFHGFSAIIRIASGKPFAAAFSIVGFALALVAAVYYEQRAIEEEEQ